MNRLVGRWELKLVALVTAIALWLYTSGQVRVDRSVTVRLEEAHVTGVPRGMRVAQIQPREFQVQLSAPLGRWSEAGPDPRPRLALDERELDGDRLLIPLTSRILGFPSDVRIVRTEPADLRAITVVVTREREENLAIDPPKVIAPAGFDARIEVEPPTVLVRAPSEIIQALRQEGRVRMRPIDLSRVDAAEIPTQRVQLQPADANVALASSAWATITLTAVRGTSRRVVVPVSLVATDGLRQGSDLVIEPQEVAVVVHGPEAQLKELRPEVDLVAFAAVRSDLPLDQPQRVMVSVVGPAWLAAEPAAVTVVRRPRAGRDGERPAP